ncbi:hypothetical protein [Archangium violaceum]|uniref:Uncharacterized protein n=1 Tax=Archangium violaceum Cb vi76 TaxID=1406225 RepID=A0A084SHP0_9BACT|nr:hypothetical protein [Archangium violaceum]KFA87975.1 hypothetical protein Q664_44260 [Archangium violaceum Cb vi76]
MPAIPAITFPSQPISGALTQRLTALRLTSATAAREEVRSLRLQRTELAPSVARVFHASEHKALNFTRGVIANWHDDTEAETDAEPLLDWARRGGVQQRRMMVRAFRQQRRGLLVVHHIGGMARADARTFMKDFFAAGGSLDDVAEWFQRAGHVLRTERSGTPGTDGLFSKAWNWVKGAVKTVGDALKAAGKSLAKAIGKVVKWTASKIADFVEGVLEAGRKVGEILAEALEKGQDALKKFVRAVLDAGRKIREVVQSVVQWSAASLEKLFRGLRTAGRKLAEVAREVARFTGTTVRRLVEGLYRAYRQTRDILVAFVKDQVSTLRMVLEGLFRAGVQLGKAIADIVRNVASQFREGFFKGLIALGKSPFLIMKEALKTTAGVATLAFATLLDILGGHRPLTAAEKLQARRVFGKSIDLNRVKVAVASIPADLVNLINGTRPFTTMYVLNFASWREVSIKTLIHELTHTWQGVVAGPVYMIEALHAQTLGEGYTVTNAMLRARGNKLSRFNREQQAVIVEEFWYEQWGRRDFPSLRGRGLDVNLLRPYARDVFKGPTRVVVPLPRPRRKPLPPIRIPSAAAARLGRVHAP